MYYSSPQYHVSVNLCHRPLLHSARQKHKASAQDERRTGSRLIIFVIGGISFSEMRSAYEVTQSVKSCEVILGEHQFRFTQIKDCLCLEYGLTVF